MKMYTNAKVLDEKLSRLEHDANILCERITLNNLHLTCTIIIGKSRVYSSLSAINV